MAELVRRGLEYMLAVVPSGKATKGWQLPPAQDLQSADSFLQEGWRTALHMGDRNVAETQAPYGKSTS